MICSRTAVYGEPPQPPRRTRHKRNLESRERSSVGAGDEQLQSRRGRDRIKGDRVQMKILDELWYGNNVAPYGNRPVALQLS